MRKLIFLLLLPCVVFADDTRIGLANQTSAIEMSMCVPSISAQGCLHVDEDVANLVIEVWGEDGTIVATYDAATEIEDIAVIGTYAAPSANNVRVSPQGGTGADLTQMMFADAVYNGQDEVTICVSDGQSTIMDMCRHVFLQPHTDLQSILTDTGTTLDGLIDTLVLRSNHVHQTTLATVASESSFTLTTGSASDDAYNGWTFGIIDSIDNEIQFGGFVTDYVGSTKTITNSVDLPNTPTAADKIVLIPNFASVGRMESDTVTASAIAADAIGESEIAANAITNSEFATDAINAGVIAANAVGESELAPDAITNSEIAADAIGSSEIASNAIGAAELAASAIGASEIGTDAIDADAIAADAVGAAEIAADALTASEIAANAIGASELATDAIGAAELATDAIDADAVAADVSTEIWAISCEDQGGGYSCREALNLLLAEGMGTAVYDTGSRTWTVSDPSGTETRFTLVYGAELDGDRSTSTPAPFTP